MTYFINKIVFHEKLTFSEQLSQTCVILWLFDCTVNILFRVTIFPT